MIYCFGKFQLDTQLFELRRDHDSVPIVPRAFDVLRLLIENRERPVSRDELIETVWDGRIVSEATLSSSINAVRRAVDDDGKRQEVIRTVRRRGFHFAAPVTAINDATSPGEGARSEATAKWPIAHGTAPRGPHTSGGSALAVLPFENLSQDVDQTHFVESLRKGVVAAIWRWRSLPVIAPDTIVDDQGSHTYQFYGARYVLKGGVRKIGDRVRVTAQLIDAVTGHHILAERIDRRYSETFDLEDELTNEIVAKVAPKLERIEHERVKIRQPRTLDPHYLVQCGIALLDEYTKEGNLRARELFRDALELHPSHSRALSGIALAYSRALMSGYEHDREAATNQAVEAGHKAVGFDAGDAFAHNALGMSYLWARENGAGLSSFEKAMKLNPSYGHPRGSLGDTLVRSGRTEDGIAKMKEALRLNPNAPNIRHFNAFLARACITARRHEEAVHWARMAIHLKSDLGHAYCLLAVGLGHLGLTEEAKGALDRCKQVQPDFFDSAVELSPNEDPSANKHFLDGLCRAGWEG